jgi:5-methylcytosine-specific restriction endonuclease McrA
MVRFEQNAEEIRAKERAYCTANRDKIRAKKKRWKARHKDVVLAREASKREANREQLREYHKRWRAENIEHAREYDRIFSHRRRAQLVGSGGSHTSEEWTAIKKAQNYMCLMCGRSEPEIKLTRDHVLPVSRGGTDFADNIQGLCGSCNSRKNAKHIDFRISSS